MKNHIFMTLLCALVGGASVQGEEGSSVAQSTLEDGANTQTAPVGGIDQSQGSSGAQSTLEDGANTQAAPDRKDTPVKSVEYTPEEDTLSIDGLIGKLTNRRRVLVVDYTTHKNNSELCGTSYRDKFTSVEDTYVVKNFKSIFEKDVKDSKFDKAIQDFKKSFITFDNSENRMSGTEIDNHIKNYVEYSLTKQSDRQTTQWYKEWEEENGVMKKRYRSSKDTKTSDNSSSTLGKLYNSVTSFTWLKDANTTESFDSELEKFYKATKDFKTSFITFNKILGRFNGKDFIVMSDQEINNHIKNYVEYYFTQETDKKNTEWYKYWEKMSTIIEQRCKKRALIHV